MASMFTGLLTRSERILLEAVLTCESVYRRPGIGSSSPHHKYSLLPQEVRTVVDRATETFRKKKDGGYKAVRIFNYGGRKPEERRFVVVGQHRSGEYRVLYPREEQGLGEEIATRACQLAHRWWTLKIVGGLEWVLLMLGAYTAASGFSGFDRPFEFDAGLWMPSPAVLLFVGSLLIGVSVCLCILRRSHITRALEALGISNNE